MSVRVRFAPSPTGYLHIGGLRTALYNYLYARKKQGKFIIRLEDTDQSRLVKGAAVQLLESLKASNLDWDEGIFFNKDQEIIEKGEKGPYIQSKRLDIYKKYVNQLLEQGKAYYCFCSQERIDKLREDQKSHGLAPKYDKHCLNLSKEEIKEKLDNGESYVIRLNVESNQLIEFTDLIRGKIQINSNDIDDQVLLKSDGYPTYHLANVVDDHLMEITHVIRGEEWISSTPKHILMYKAFAWDYPEFAHLPLLLNPDKSKLSKRQGDVAVQDYLKKGYLPEALVNYVALLGWNPGDDREKFSLQELIKNFSLDRCGKSGAVFDQEKLKWLNGVYIRELKEDDLWLAVKPYLFDYIEENYSDYVDQEDYLKKIVSIQQERLNVLMEIIDDIDYFFVKADDLSYDVNLLVWRKSDAEDAKNKLEKVKDYLENYNNSWDIKALNDNIIKWIKSNDYGVGDVLWPLRVALCGQKNSPSPFELLWALGLEKSLARIEKAITMLG